MFRRVWIMAGVLLLAAPQAQANPISVDAFRVRKMPNSFDVQVTYGSDGAGGTGAITIKSLKRDGKEITPSWKAATYTANTGSGLRALAARQHCDCTVAKGMRKYELTVEGVYGGSKTITHTVTVNVSDAPTVKKDAGAKGDLAPWSIPEPDKVQGADCTSICKGGTGKDGGSAASDGGPKMARETDGCSVAGGAFGGSTLLLLALVALVRRRR